MPLMRHVVVSAQGLNKILLRRSCLVTPIESSYANAVSASHPGPLRRTNPPGGYAAGRCTGIDPPTPSNLH